MHLAERPKVAFISEHASPAALLGGVDAGGQNVYVDEISRNLGAMGISVDIFTRLDSPESPGVRNWSKGVRIINVPAGPKQHVFRDDLWTLMPEFTRNMLDFIKRNNIRYDLIHSNFWMSGWAATKLKHRANIPMIHIFHAMGKTKRKHQGDMDTSPTERITIEQLVASEADYLIAQCPSEKLELTEDYGVDPAKVVIIPSAVNIERFRPIGKEAARTLIGLDWRGPVIGYVGRIIPRKDVRNIVLALHKVITNRPDLNPLLMLVGGETREPDPKATPEIRVLQSMILELGLQDRVIFIGKRQPDELYAYYSAADLIVTTPWYEPFGLTPLEAMACGRPVIGSNVGGIAFTVSDGETGYLVPPKSPETLAARIIELLDKDDLRERMGSNARHRVVKLFTWERAAELTAQLYVKALSKKLHIANTDYRKESDYEYR